MITCTRDAVLQGEIFKIGSGFLVHPAGLCLARKQPRAPGSRSSVVALEARTAFAASVGTELCNRILRRFSRKNRLNTARANPARILRFSCLAGRSDGDARFLSV